MKKLYSQKLLYKHYVYKIKLVIPFDGKTIAKKDREDYIKRMQSWFKRYCKDASRTTISWCSKRVEVGKHGHDKKRYKVDYTCNVLLYLKNANAYQRALKKYEKYAVEVTVPANAAHEEMIRQGSILEIREKLYYDEYRYRMSFRKAFNRSILAEIRDALVDGIGEDDLENQLYYMSNNNFVYLRTNEDVMYMRLSLCDHVKDITVVVLSSELAEL